MNCTIEDFGPDFREGFNRNLALYGFDFENNHGFRNNFGQLYPKNAS